MRCTRAGLSVGGRPARSMGEVIHASGNKGNSSRLHLTPWLSEGREKVATLKIYGASDDLIEVEGEIHEEFSPLADEPSLLAFSDGTLLQIQYGAGNKAFWRLQPLIYGAASYSKVEATDEDENYSDIVTLEGEIKWVVCGYQWARAAK